MRRLILVTALMAVITTAGCSTAQEPTTTPTSTSSGPGTSTSSPSGDSDLDPSCPPPDTTPPVTGWLYVQTDPDPDPEADKERLIKLAQETQPGLSYEEAKRQVEERLASAAASEAATP